MKNKFCIKSDVFTTRGNTKAMVGPWKPTREEALDAFWAKLMKAKHGSHFRFVFLAERKASASEANSKDKRGVPYTTVTDDETMAWLKAGILARVKIEADRVRQGQREAIVEKHMRAMQDELQVAGIESFGVAGGIPYAGEDGTTHMHLFFVMGGDVTANGEPLSPSEFVGDVARYMTAWTPAG